MKLLSTRHLILAASALALTAFAARADDAQLIREAADRAQIEALMWRYVRALDSYDEQAYAAVFTEDGQFGTGANATRGRAALQQMVAGLEKASAERTAASGSAAPAMHHVITNPSIEFVDATHARYHSYWMTVFGPAEQGEMPRVAAVGRGIDELVKIDGQWLIRLRNVAPEN
jgi:uncharacterized protein (TIGR02246 family)